MSTATCASAVENLDDSLFLVVGELVTLIALICPSAALDGDSIMLL